MLYVGDAVVIKMKEVMQSEHGSSIRSIPPGFTTGMDRYCGRDFEISAIDDGQFFTLHGVPGYTFADWMVHKVDDSLTLRRIRVGDSSRLISEQDLPIYIRELERAGYLYEKEYGVIILTREGDEAVRI